LKHRINLSTWLKYRINLNIEFGRLQEMKKTIVLLSVLLVLLFAIPIVSAAVPQSGYLWWPNDPSVKVAVIGPQHDRIPNTSFGPSGQYPGGELLKWINSKEACLADSNSQYTLDPSVAHPANGDYANTVGIKVTSGNCKGFKGWAFHYAALHDKKSR
jgi:hypothetical protein